MAGALQVVRRELLLEGFIWARAASAWAASCWSVSSPSRSLSLALELISRSSAPRSRRRFDRPHPRRRIGLSGVQFLISLEDRVGGCYRQFRVIGDIANDDLIASFWPMTLSRRSISSGHLAEAGFGDQFDRPLGGSPRAKDLDLIGDEAFGRSVDPMLARLTPDHDAARAEWTDRAASGLVEEVLSTKHNATVIAASTSLRGRLPRTASSTEHFDSLPHFPGL